MKILFIPMLIAMLAGCTPSGSQSQANGQAQQAMPVDVATPLRKSVTNWDEFTGRLDAVEEVEVRARVSGYLESVEFEDGAMVEAGDLLFVIDPRPFRAALAQAKAERTRDQVRLTQARNDLERAKRLFASRAISEEELDTRTQDELAARAAVEAAEAAVEAAALDLEFTQVRAPIAGRIGRRRVTEGNLVSGGSANATLLTVIVSLDPIYAYFTGDENAYLRYLRLDRIGERPSSHGANNPVLLGLSDEDGFPHEGTMDFVDNQVDQGTGTIEGRAIFSNPDLILTPGMFADILLVGKGPYEALLIPAEAVATDQAQKFVYVLDEEDRPQRRDIKLGRRVGALRIVEDGLNPNERVVIRGLQRIRGDAPLAPEETEIADPGTDIARS